MAVREHFWTFQLDWLNIMMALGVDSMNGIPEDKRQRAIKRVSRSFNQESLMKLEPWELDQLVIKELKTLMKKELYLNTKKQDKIEKEIQSKIVPFKQGGIIRIDPRDFKDLDMNAEPEEMIKHIYKRIMGNKDDDDDNDDDVNKIDEDTTGYYI